MKRVWVAGLLMTIATSIGVAPYQPVTASPTQVVLSAGDIADVEGGPPTFPSYSGPRVTIPLTLSEPAPEQFTLSWGTTTTGTATANVDFGYVSGYYTFGVGQTSGKLKVQLVGDKIDETDETVVVWMEAPAPVVVATPSATATILDDDPSPGAGPNLAAGDVTVTEGNAGTRARLTFTLSKTVGKNTTFAWTTVGGSATAATDFKPRSGTAIIYTPQRSTSIGIPILPETGAEPSESFTVVISNASPGIGITRPTGTITIVDDD